MADVSSENVFEIIAVYFANCYWNTLYNLALDAWREEQFDKMEEAYKTMIDRYSRAFCAPNEQNERLNKYYLRIIKDLYLNYKEFLHSSDTLLGFVDTMSKLFLPKQYYKSLSSRDPKKDVIFRKILTKTLMKFTIYISHEEVKNVIDEKLRKDKKYVVEWKRKFIDILTQERNEFCTLLLAQNSGIDIRNRDDIPQIPKEVCDKLQLEIKKLINEKADLVHRLNKYVKYINLLKKIIQERDAEHISDTESVPESSPKRRISRNASQRLSRRTGRNVEKSEPVPEPTPEQPSEALEDLKNEEFSGDEFVDKTEPENIEEVDLPDESLMADE